LATVGFIGLITLEEMTMQTAIGQSLRRKRKLESAILKCTDSQKLIDLQKKFNVESKVYEYLLNKIK